MPKPKRKKIRSNSPWLNDRMDQELAEKKQQCVRLSEQGYNYREISEMLGITHSSVRDWIVAEKGKQEKLTD